jgi:prepilin-type N-terminal cleavage/methylation domain-containing protein
LKAAPAKAGRPGRGRRKGVTLIELMVVVVIVTVVSGAFFTMLQLSMRNEARQQDILAQTQNLRAALYTVSRDIRMAGNGLVLTGSPTVYIYIDPGATESRIQREEGWFRYSGFENYGARAIYGLDSGTDSSAADVLTIFRAEMESGGPLGRLNVNFNPNSSAALILQEAVIEGVNVSDGDLVAVANGNQVVIVQVRFSSAGLSTTTLNLGDRFRPKDNFPGGQSFPPGSMVYNLRDIALVTYYLDAVNHRLMANYHDLTLVDSDPDDAANPHLVTVANDIEDFQVAYFVTQPMNTSGLTEVDQLSEAELIGGTTVRAVRLVIVSRSARSSEINAGADSVEVRGHQAVSDRGHSRRVMSEIVQLRNF